MKKPILIFDFDGTIADTHHFVIGIYNQLCDEFNCKRIENDDIDFLKDHTSQEIISHLNISIFKIPALLSKAKKEFFNGIEHLAPIADIRGVLRNLKDNGITIGILSSNDSRNVNTFLAHHQLDFFDFIHTTSKVWSKNTSLKKLIQMKNFNFKDVIYVGDETRDIDAAKKLNIKVAAVTWGYNSAKVLEKHSPDYQIDHPKDLLQLI